MITHVAIQYNGRTYSLPKPNRHHDIIRLIYKETGKGIDGPDVQGFLDNYGNFLNRYEAMDHAKQHNQLIRPENQTNIYNGSKLFSEDIW